MEKPWFDTCGYIGTSHPELEGNDACVFWKLNACRTHHNRPYINSLLRLSRQWSIHQHPTCSLMRPSTTLIIQEGPCLVIVVVQRQPSATCFLVGESWVAIFAGDEMIRSLQSLTRGVLKFWAACRRIHSLYGMWHLAKFCCLLKCIFTFCDLIRMHRNLQLLSSTRSQLSKSKRNQSNDQAIAVSWPMIQT